MEKANHHRHQARVADLSWQPSNDACTDQRNADADQHNSEKDDAPSLPHDRAAL